MNFFLANIFNGKLKDPLFYIGLITLSYWIADTYLKIFILHAPNRMLWYSSAGLLITTIGLFKRSSFLLTAMFCALVINESIWTISFFSNLFFHKDITNVASYAFKQDYPIYKFIITTYHLTLVPAATIGLVTVRKIHRFGWLGSFCFVTFLALLAFLFPDPFGENVNCVARETVGSCRLYFSYLYPLGQFWGMIAAFGSLTLVIYLPLNYLLLYISKK